MPSLSKKEYRFIGMQLTRQNPDLAMSILRSHTTDKVMPEVTDHGLMAVYLVRFCLYINHTTEDIVGCLRKPELVDVRRQFIAAMIHLYNPHVYTQQFDNLLFSYRFVKCLAETLHVDHSNMSKHLREVIIRERVYEAFAAQVQETLTAIKREEVSDGSA